MQLGFKPDCKISPDPSIPFPCWCICRGVAPKVENNHGELPHSVNLHLSHVCSWIKNAAKSAHSTDKEQHRASPILGLQQSGAEPQAGTCNNSCGATAAGGKGNEQQRGWEQHTAIQEQKIPLCCSMQATLAMLASVHQAPMEPRTPHAVALAQGMPCCAMWCCAMLLCSAQHWEQRGAALGLLRSERFLN